MASPATRSGDVLNDAYELQELVSSEGPLEVYRARDKRTRGELRVKLLRAEFALQGQVVERFLRAPRSLSALTHASLPRVRIDTDDTGIPFVVEEAIEGRALSALTGSFPQGLPLPMAMQLCVPLLEALTLAHGHGLTHGAIDEEHVKVLGTPDAPLPKLIGLGASAGERSPQHEAFRAPESSNAADARATKQADVYAFGVLLYKMLSGALPFRSGKKSAMPLDEIAPHLPAAWVKLTTGCLQSSHVTRIKDAGALLAELRRCSEPPPKPASVVAVEAQTRPSVVKREALEAPAEVRESEPAREAQRVAEPPPLVEALDATVAARASDPALARTRATPLPADEAPPEASGEEKKKQAARDAAAKLSAKTKPQRVSKDPARSSQPEAKAEPKAEAKPEAKAEPKPQPRPEATPLPPKLEPARPRPPPAAMALSVVQLDALRALRATEEEDDSRDRWLALFFMLLWLLLLQYGTPLLSDPDFETARATFGPKLRMATTVFTVAAVIGTVRALVAQSRRSLIQRVRSLVLQVVVVSIVLVTATLYTSQPGIALAAGFARRALPWGMGATFLFFGFDYAARGARQVTTQLVYAVVALLMAGGSGYGSYRNIVAGVKNERKRASALLAKRNTDATTTTTAGTLEAIRRQLTTTDKTQATSGASPGDPSSIKQRTRLGGSEDQDMMPARELEANRTQNQKALEGLRDRLPSVSTATPQQP